VAQRPPFIGGKRVEVALAQALLGAERGVRAQFVFFVRGWRLCTGLRGRACRERIGETVVAARRRHAALHLRQQQRAQLAFPIRVAPEQIEGGVEEVAFVRRGDQ
jgi:hypothetical protein